MKPNDMLLFIAISSFILLFDDAAAQPVNQHCSKTKFPIVCQAAVDSYLPPNSTPDAVSVFAANIKATIAKIQTALAAANKARDDPSLDSSMKPELTVSIEFYASSLFRYKKVLEALKTGNIVEAGIQAGSAYTSNRCFEIFSNPMFSVVLRVSPLVSANDELRQMALNCLDFSKFIFDQQ